jgi:hypothetical protein
LINSGVVIATAGKNAIKLINNIIIKQIIAMLAKKLNNAWNGENTMDVGVGLEDTDLSCSESVFTFTEVPDLTSENARDKIR